MPISALFHEFLDVLAQLDVAALDLMQLSQVAYELLDTAVVFSQHFVDVFLDLFFLVGDGQVLLLNRLESVVPVPLHHEELVLQLFFLLLQCLSLFFQFGLKFNLVVGDGLLGQDNLV